MQGSTVIPPTVVVDINVLATTILAMVTAWIGYLTLKMRTEAEVREKQAEKRNDELIKLNAERGASTEAQLDQIHKVTNNSFSEAKDEIKSLRETVANLVAERATERQNPSTVPMPSIGTPDGINPVVGNALPEEIKLTAPVNLTVNAP